MKHFPITQKTGENLILKVGIDNDINDCRDLFMNDNHDVAQLFALTLTNYNIRGTRTRGVNLTGLESKDTQYQKIGTEENVRD